MPFNVKAKIRIEYFLPDTRLFIILYSGLLSTLKLTNCLSFSLIDILYPLITPLHLSIGGEFHLIIIDVAFNISILKFSGGLSGTSDGV